MSSIIFVQLLLALRVIDTTTDTWRQCSEWVPLDLLSFVVERDPSRLAAGLQLQQAAGLRGLRLTSPHGSMSFPSSQLLQGCHLLPKNFSIVVTLRVPRTAPQRSEYILSLTEQRAPDGKEEQKGGGQLAGPNVLLALKVSSKRLRLTMKAEPGPREQWVFGGLRLADGHWHTLVLSVAQQQVALTLDCSRKQSFSRPGSTELNMEEATFHIGSRGKWEGLFSGLLRQLVLVPASDAAQLICPSLHPQTAALSVPPLLLDLPAPQGKAALGSHEGVVEVDGGSEREQRVRVGRRKSCSQQSEAELWFDPLSKGLYLCDGAAWTALLQDQGRLDYVLEHQVLGTSSETQDIELFHLPGVGVMAAMAQLSEASGSALYQWTQGGFQLFQKISSSGALAWRHFAMGKKVFLVMSNSGGCSQHGDGQDHTRWDFSVIYKWSKRRKRFLQLQTLKTHCARDWEAFAIHGHSFLAVANHRTGDNNHTISSVIYKWNRSSMSFEVHQTLQTSGAYDWEFFSVGAFHFLAVANAFDGMSTSVDSAIYIWLNGSFQLFQTIKTFCATDWEMFEISGRVFLAVANGQRLDGTGPALYAINSTLYELDMSHRMFVRFQDILTYSAVDWEFFSLGDQHFLVVANSFNGESYSLNSVLYRWQGYEGFVPVHWLPTIGCSDWEFFSSEGQSYLIYSSAKAPLSKVFQLKLY